jgi:hypothetical protein
MQKKLAVDLGSLLTFFTILLIILLVLEVNYLINAIFFTVVEF